MSVECPTCVLVRSYTINSQYICLWYIRQSVEPRTHEWAHYIYKYVYMQQSKQRSYSWIHWQAGLWTNETFTSITHGIHTIYAYTCMHIAIAIDKHKRIRTVANIRYNRTVLHLKYFMSDHRTVKVGRFTVYLLCVSFLILLFPIHKTNILMCFLNAVTNIVDFGILFFIFVSVFFFFIHLFSSSTWNCAVD